MNQYVKWGLYAGVAYVVWRLWAGDDLSAILQLQFLNKGSEAQGSTQNVGGVTKPLANSKVSKATGVIAGGDGSSFMGNESASQPLIDKYLPNWRL